MEKEQPSFRCHESIILKLSVCGDPPRRALVPWTSQFEDPVLLSIFVQGEGGRHLGLGGRGQCAKAVLSETAFDLYVIVNMRGIVKQLHEGVRALESRAWLENPTLTSVLTKPNKQPGHCWGRGSILQGTCPPPTSRLEAPTDGYSYSSANNCPKLAFQTTIKLGALKSLSY